MAEAQEPRKPPDKTRRAAVLATAGIVVIMGLAVFYVAAVAPLRETHKVVRAWSNGEINEEEAGPWAAKNWHDEWPHTTDDIVGAYAIHRLGGPERAPDRLAAYLRLPKWLKADREGAVDLLAHCGKPGIPLLIAVARDRTEDDEVRLVAVNRLHWFEPVEHLPPRPASAALEGIRFTATDVFGRIIYIGLPPDAEIERIIKAVCEKHSLQYEPPKPDD